MRRSKHGARLVLALSFAVASADARAQAEVVRTLQDPEFADLAYFLAHAR